MDASNDNGNGRVTLAELKKDIAYLIEQLRTQTQETREYRQRLEERIRHLETVQEKHTAEIGTLTKCVDDTGDKVNDIQGKFVWWNGLNSLGAIIAGILGGAK